MNLSPPLSTWTSNPPVQIRPIAVTSVFLLCVSLIHASVAWRRIDSAPHGVLPPPHADVNPTASLAVNVNNDGNVDFIVGGRNSGPALTLWRYGAGLWTTEVIEPDAIRIEAGGAAHDITGNGYPDIVFGGDSRSGEIWWWENPHPAKGRWKRHLLKRDQFFQHHDQIFGDFDGDGDIDVVVGEHRNPGRINRVILFENLDGRGGAWRLHVIDQGPSNVIDHHDGTIAVDLDGDGDLDIVSIGFYNNKVWVLENKAIDRPARLTAAKPSVPQTR
jgi:hypothetical protein